MQEGSGERQRPRFTVLICSDRGLELVAGRGGELRLALTLILRQKSTLHTSGSVWLCPTGNVNTAKAAQCCCRWLSHLELFTEAPPLLRLMLLGHPPHAEEHHFPDHVHVNNFHPKISSWFQRTIHIFLAGPSSGLIKIRNMQERVCRQSLKLEKCSKIFDRTDSGIMH